MRFYLSSYKIGNDPNKLKSLLPSRASSVYISNGMDYGRAESRNKHREWDMRELREIGLTPKPLDLRDYFGKTAELRSTLQYVDLIYTSGGNVFDLRMALKLSGLDELLRDFIKTGKVWAGYSAAVCVLSPTLRGYHIVDDPHLKTYGDYDTVWEGIGVIDWQFAPHFKSDHSESEDVDKEVTYFRENHMKYRTLKDGEVIIL